MASPSVGSVDQRNVVGSVGGLSHLFNIFVGTTDGLVLRYPKLSGVSILAAHADAHLGFPARLPHVFSYGQQANFHSWACLSAWSLVLFSDCLSVEIAAGVSWFAGFEFCYS